MNLYSHKQRWKIVLMVVAVLIVGASLWYTGSIASKLRKEEIKKVEQWASDLRNNILQLNIANQSFNQQREAYLELKAKERTDVERWAAATRELSRDQLDYTFLISIIQENTTVPVILTDEHDAVSSTKNIGFERKDFAELVASRHPHWEKTKVRKYVDSLYRDTLLALVSEWKTHYEPIEISVMGSTRNRVYYRESDKLINFDKKIASLQRRSDSLFTDFNTRLATGNPLVPMIFVEDSTGWVIASNLPPEEWQEPQQLALHLKEMRGDNDSIPVYFGDELRGYIFYQNSELLSQLEVYPYIQFGIIGVFLLIAYFLFSTFRNAEQNQVWVGMAKETAHQLGTPISSLMAWTELLKDQGIRDEVILEMNKDLDRLQTVSDRFSKIGSAGKMEAADMVEVIHDMLAYLEKRVSNKVKFHVQHEGDCKVPINVPLIAWVIENLTKNAIDAMEGAGEVTYSVSSDGKKLYVDVKDTGKGIPQGKFKTVFRPGYTTKQRGWGLGLALVKRIVEEYHRGRIFVKESSPGKGTTFRIVLRRN